jgi:uncharacterized membrane protein HdeD (DUF308 family)
MTAETMKTDAEQLGFPWWLVLLEGIAALILGIMLMTNSAATAIVLVQVLGIYWLIKGVFAIISIFLDSTAWGWKLFVGILGVAAGIIVLQHPLLSPLFVGSAFVIILGIQGLIIGVVNVIQAFQGAGWGAGILGILSILLGVVLLTNVFVATFSLYLVLGIFMIIGGIAAIVMAFRLK